MNKSYVVVTILLFSVLVSGLILYFSEINKNNIDEINEEYVDDNQIESEEIFVDEDIEINEVDNKKPTWKLFTDRKYGYEYLRLYDDYHAQKFDVNVFAATSTLEVFVKNFWEFNKVEAYKKVTISDSEAYQFVLNNKLSWPEGSGISFEGEKRLVTIIDNAAGAKIVIVFPYSEDVDDEEDSAIYKKMFESFRADKNLIPEKVKPSDWTGVEGLDFGFRYPANLFKSVAVPDELNDLNTYSYWLSSHENLYGDVSVYVKSEKFEPNNIVGIYGAVENPEVVKIGDRIAYRYLEGDAGCGHQKVLTALGEDKTLEILFSSCYDYVYPLYEEEELMQSILDTFEFKK